MIKGIFSICFFIISLMPIFAEVELNKVLDQIKFKGITQFNLEEMVNKVDLEIKVGRKILLQDLKKDMNSFYLLGTFSEISAKSEFLNNKHILVFYFQENPIIKRIKFIVNHNDFHIPLNNFALKSTIGETLNFQNIEQDKVIIDEWAQKKDLFFYELEKIEFHDQCLFFYLNIAVINKVYIDGVDKHYKPYLLRDLRLNERHMITNKSLENAKQRLINTNYFKYVSPAQIKASGKKNAYNIEFQVKEKKLNRIEGGIETDEEEFVGFMQTIHHHNLMISDQIAAKIQFGKQQKQFDVRSYNLMYTQPWFLNKWPWKFSVQAWLDIKQEVLASQSTDNSARLIQDNRKGISFTSTLPLKNPFYKLQFKYKHENVLPVNADDFTAYTLNSFSNSILYNNIGLDFNPQKGRYWQISYENGGKIGFLKLNGLDFWRFEANYAQFFLFYDYIFGFNIKTNIFESNEEQDTLEVEKYILGGASSLRGYKDKSYPFVGNHRVIINTEIRKNFSEKWQGIFFIDAGKIIVGNNIIDELKSPELGTGIGIRYFSILGPVRLDFAHSKQENAIHFSLGQMF